MTWNVNDLRQNKKKPSVLDAPSVSVDAPLPEKTPRMELGDLAEALILEEIPETFPLEFRREMQEMGLLDERTARLLSRLMTRGIVDI